MLKNPIVRLILSKVQPTNVTVATVQTVAQVMGGKMDAVMATALASTISESGSSYSNVLELLESEDCKPLIQAFLKEDAETASPTGVTVCPACRAIFELGAGDQ